MGRLTFVNLSALLCASLYVQGVHGKVTRQGNFLSSTTMKKQAHLRVKQALQIRGGENQLDLSVGWLTNLGTPAALVSRIYLRHPGIYDD